MTASREAVGWRSRGSCSDPNPAPFCEFGCTDEADEPGNDEGFLREREPSCLGRASPTGNPACVKGGEGPEKV